MFKLAVADSQQPFCLSYTYSRFAIADVVLLRVILDCVKVVTFSCANFVLLIIDRSLSQQYESSRKAIKQAH